MKTMGAKWFTVSNCKSIFRVKQKQKSEKKANDEYANQENAYQTSFQVASLLPPRQFSIGNQLRNIDKIRISSIKCGRIGSPLFIQHKQIFTRQLSR